MERPAGVTTIALIFFLVAAYLVLGGAVMLIRPGLIPMAAGASLLGGLEIAGPFAFLLAGGLAGLIALGLLRLNNWARRAAMITALAGIVLLIPGVSGSVASLQIGTLAWGGLGIILRAAVLWYLYQEPVAAAFAR
jgi:hypothetical protein